MDLENGVVIIASPNYEYEIREQLDEMGFTIWSNYFEPSFWGVILSRFLRAEIGKFNCSTQGGRCFIIGNAPSLCVDNLETLHQNGETTFAVNKIYNLFNQTKWRPSYYFAQDVKAIPEADVIKQMHMPKFLASYTAKNIFFDENTYYFDLDINSWYYEKPYNMKFSTEIEHLYNGGTVAYTAIQAAISMGYDEIYLLGIDCKYTLEVMHDGTIVNNNTDTHFYSEKINRPFYSDMVSEAFECASEYANSNGVKIYNATRGGALEVFERVEFDSLF